jgi:hypothetical protein
MRNVELRRLIDFSRHRAQAALSFSTQEHRMMNTFARTAHVAAAPSNAIATTVNSGTPFRRLAADDRKDSLTVGQGVAMLLNNSRFDTPQSEAEGDWANWGEPVPNDWKKLA